jgi:membrane dipeptidase
LIDVVGVDHVAIGTDLDANFRPVLMTYSQFPDVAELLRERGVDGGEVDKVLGGNFIRLFAEIERAADVSR